jgi:hypothetical protein
MKQGLEGQTTAHRQVDCTNDSNILLDEPQNCTKTSIIKLAVELDVDFYMYVEIWKKLWTFLTLEYRIMCMRS